MKAYMTVSTKKGLYADAEAVVPNLRAAQEWSTMIMDSLRDEIDGEKLLDWTKIELVVER